MSVPYVVSGDIKTLLAQWAKAGGFILPSATYFDELRSAFSDRMHQLFPAFELISEEKIIPQFQEITNRRCLPVVSMETVYLNTKYRLELARTANREGRDMGLASRNGVPAHIQAERLAEQGLKDVVLADDVIFTGDQIQTAVDLLSRCGLRVVEVCAAIGVENGTEQIKRLGMPVHCVHTYQRVIDQVCERDFYPGTPYSGRMMAEDTRYAVHYIIPSDNLVTWASIPKEEAFSISCFCLDMTTKLFAEISRCSSRTVTNQDLPRPFQDDVPDYLQLATLHT